MKKEERIKKLKSVLLCLLSHPDNEPNSEFADRISDLEEIIEFELPQVENNNGWIKVESEDDLPEVTSTYFVYSTTWYEPFFRIDVFTGRLKNSFSNGKSCFDYYQKITKPERPIY